MNFHAMAEKIAAIFANEIRASDRISDIWLGCFEETDTGPDLRLVFSCGSEGYLLDPAPTEQQRRKLFTKYCNDFVACHTEEALQLAYRLRDRGKARDAFTIIRLCAERDLSQLVFEAAIDTNRQEVELTRRPPKRDIEIGDCRCHLNVMIDGENYSLGRWTDYDSEHDVHDEGFVQLKELFSAANLVEIWHAGQTAS